MIFYQKANLIDFAEINSFQTCVESILEYISNTYVNALSQKKLATQKAFWPQKVGSSGIEHHNYFQA